MSRLWIKWRQQFGGGWKLSIQEGEVAGGSREMQWRVSGMRGPSTIREWERVS